MLSFSFIRNFSTLFVGLALGLSSCSSATAQPPTSVVDNYIVVLRDSAEPLAVAREHANAHALNVAFIYEHALKGYSARIPAHRVAEVARDSRVLFISPDRTVKVSGQTMPTGIDRIQADLSSTKSGDGAGSVNVAVAIIDTGIDTTHQDLNVVGGKNCVAGSRSYSDGNGHGTHVAGTVAAKDNSIGVMGVAPGAPLYAVRVLDDTGSGSWSSVICGIDWVSANTAKNRIKIANMSLSGVGADDGNCGNTNNDALHKAICNSVAKGVMYVVAAGNDSKDIATAVPAAYNEVLTVTALADYNGNQSGGTASTCGANVEDAAASFSNFTVSSSTDATHTIAAPGSCITSTWKGNSYNTLYGTSMAAPHVAGAAALCIGSGTCSGLTPYQLLLKLKTDATNQPASYGFIGDPNSPNGTRYYGHLLYGGSY